MSAALLVIDVQNAIDDPRYANRGQKGMEQAIAALLARWREKGDPVIFIRDDSTDPQSPFRPGQSGNDFKPEIAPQSHEIVIDKRTSSAFVGTDLMQVLEGFGCSELVVTGIWLEACVESTVRMAADLGFMVFIPQDCVASLGQNNKNNRKWTADEVHALTLAILEGAYANILSSTDLLMEAQQ